VEGFIRGWERSDRLAQPNTARGGAAKQTVGAAPPDESRSEGTRAQARAERQGKAFLVTFEAFVKSDPP